MTKSLLITVLFFAPFIVTSQSFQEQSKYDVSIENPFGLPNPEAPQEVKDFEPMIGICNCKSINRNPDGTWQDTVQMWWKFKYIMNGKAVQDETWKADGNHTGSIRQFNADSARWYVTFFNANTVSPKPSTWEGTREGGQIVLDKPQPAPNGFDGFSRLTFFDFSDEGYNWKGEWVSADGSIVYPFWQIFCTRPESL
ncbi:MAG: hypothetical protein NXI20_20975 [bacterium]|nr:hypothetical protein [bacterium]